MAQRYTHWTHTRIPDDVPILASEPQVDYIDDRLLSDSIYIFPNPSSTPPSPGAWSDPSVPTEFTPSELSDPESWGSSAHRGSQNSARRLGQATPSDSVDGTTNTTREAQRRDYRSLYPERGRAANTATTNIGRTRHAYRPLHYQRQRRRRSRSAIPRALLDPKPHHEIPLFLAMLSLFSVDESTAYLLTHPAPRSALFPGNVIGSEPTTTMVPAESCVDPPHGVAKLLALSRVSRSLKRGLTVACDPALMPSNPFLTPLPLFELLGLVRGVIVNSGKALCEMLRSSS